MREVGQRQSEYAAARRLGRAEHRTAPGREVWSTHATHTDSSTGERDKEKKC